MTSRRGSDVELRLLRYFLAVADTRHFGRAAERLHMAQPPLSQAIRQLESQLGVPLFERTTRQVRLTPAGELLRTDAQRILDAVDEAVNRVAALAEGRTGTLRVGFTGSASYGHLPRIARAVRDAMPGVALDIRTEMLTPAQEEALVEHRIDAGILRPPVRAEGLAYRPMAAEPLVLACQEGSALDRPDRRVVDLRGSDFVMYAAATRSVVNDAVLRTCARAGFRPHCAHEVTETSTMLALVAAGLGIALVPASARAARLDRGAFHELPDTERIDIGVAWLADSTDPLLERFVDTLTREGICGNRTRVPTLTTERAEEIA